MADNFSKNHRVTRVLNGVAAGTTTQNGTGVDMTNFDSVTFIIPFGAITAGAVTTIKAQQSSDDGVADDYTDLAGTSNTVNDDDDNQLFLLEIVRPQKRYVRPVVVRGTQNAVLDGIIAIQKRGRKYPVTHDTTSLPSGNQEIFYSPAEGTA